MDWLNHPSFRPVRDQAVASFRSKQQSFRKLNHILFLCGGANSPRREWISAYIEKRRKDTSVFYADDVWLHIAKHSKSDALQVENQLAALADVVAIVVESPGTFAELGAFAGSDVLRRKLLPIIDKKYQDTASFINTGPVRWVNEESVFRPALFVNFETIALAGAEIDARLERLPKQVPAHFMEGQVRSSPKHLLFFLCDLVAVLGPSAPNHLQFYLEQSLGEVPEPELLNYLGLAVALKLLSAREVAGNRYYETRAGTELRPYVRRRFLDLSTERAKVLSALQKIESARTVLRGGVHEPR
jgi:hypothetical protein